MRLGVGGAGPQAIGAGRERMERSDSLVLKGRMDRFWKTVRRGLKGWLGRSKAFICEMVLIGELPEYLLAQDNSKYVASARLSALLIVAVGVLSVQLASDESQRRTAADLYGYLEKVLVVGEAIAADTNTGAEQGAVEAPETPMQWQTMLALMAQGEYRLVDVDFDGLGAGFGTIGDPAGACAFKASRYTQTENAAGAKVALAVMRPSRYENIREEAAAFEDAFLVSFKDRCLAISEEGRDFLVAKIGADDKAFAVVLDDRIYERLGVVWFLYRVQTRSTLEGVEDRDAVRIARFEKFLTAAQVKRLDSYAYPFLKASDKTFLQELLVRQANAATNRAYGLDEWRDAARDIGGDAVKPTGLWGFQFERGVVARLTPLVLLA